MQSVSIVSVKASAAKIMSLSASCINPGRISVENRVRCCSTVAYACLQVLLLTYEERDCRTSRRLRLGRL
jgi:hypothetical protein